MREITVYETPDKQLHRTRELAENHMTDIFCEILDKHLKGMLANSRNFWTRSQQIEMIEYLVGDYQKARMLIIELHKALD